MKKLTYPYDCMTTWNRHKLNKWIALRKTIEYEVKWMYILSTSWHVDPSRQDEFFIEFWEQKTHQVFTNWIFTQERSTTIDIKRIFLSLLVVNDTMH